AVDAARLDQDVLGLAAIGAAVHAQRAADRAGYAGEEGETGNAGLLRRARDHDIEHRRAGGDAMIVVAGDVVEAAAEADDEAFDAAVAHDQVRAGADDGDGHLVRQITERVGEVILVFGHEQRLRRPADAEPGELAERLIGDEPAA